MTMKNLAYVCGAVCVSFSALASSVPNTVIVKFRGEEKASVQSISSMPALRFLGVTTKLIDLGNNQVLLRYSTALSAKEAARTLEKSSRVEWAQPDYILGLFPQVADELEDMDSSSVFSSLRLFAMDPSPVTAPALPNPAVDDPRISEAWGLGRINAPSAWQMQKGSKKVLVADIDTGIDYRHEDIVNNLWKGIGYDFVDNDELPFDDNAHGTHTAGTIGATGGNGKGVSGVSQQVSIMALKFISKDGFGTTANAIRAIDFAVQQGARVMSNSWGGKGDPDEENKALEDAIARADKADILFVAAAGNDGTNNDADPVYPAAYRLKNMLTVASTSPKDSISFFSNYGKESVHVGAPGGGILSTVPDNGYAKFNGTSMACPHVAGLAALILAHRPELKPVDVKKIIMDTVDPLPGLQGKTVTGGRINARAALERAQSFVAR